MAHYPADTFQEATEIAIEASNQLHGVINGDANAEVTVEDGSKIPSVRKAMVDSLYFKPPIAWAQGEYEDTYNQLREFVDGDVRTWWFAKGATVSTPVLMTTNPATDVNWTLWSAVTLNAATYKTQKRLAAEAGLNMVGSFLLGGTVTTTNDVVFYETDGKYYGWAGAFPKVVAAGATPAASGGIGAGAWVDRTDVTLRAELNVLIKTFSSVENLKLGLTNDNGQITAEQITARDIPAKTHGYYGGWAALVEPSGASDYLLTTLQRVRDTKANQSWEPDGYGDHYLSLGDGQTYVAMLQVDSETTVRNFGARNRSSSSDDVTANIQACNDHDQVAKVKLGKIDCYAQGLVINKDFYGESMTTSIIRATDNTSAIITVPENTRRRSMGDFKIVGTSKLVVGSKGIEFGNNVGRGVIENIDINEVESGLFSATDATLFMQRFDGVLVDQSDIAFNFDAFEQGYTTLTFTNCYATNCRIGFQMNTHFALVMTNCAVDYATGQAFRFLNCRNVVLESLWSEGCQFRGYVPAVVLIFNCKGLSLDGFFSFNQVVDGGGDHALILFDKSAETKDISIKNTFYEDSAGGNELLFRASVNMDDTTNVIFSGNSQTGSLIEGDLKIRNLDFECFAARRAETDSAGKVSITFADFNPPSYLTPVVTANASGKSGVISDHIIRMEHGGSFANVYIAGYDGVIDATAGVPINYQVSFTRN